MALPDLKEIGGMFRDGAESARQHFDTAIERIVARLDAISDAVDDLVDRDETVIRRVRLSADGGGAGSKTIDGPRRGHGWVIEHIASDCQPFAANCLVAIYEGATNKPDEIIWQALQSQAPAHTPLTIRTTAEKLFVNVSAAGANADVGVHIKAREFRL